MTSVGLFWPCGGITPEIRLALGVYTGPGAPAGVSCYVPAPYYGARTIAPACDTYASETVNRLVDVYHQARADGLDMAVVSFGNGVPARPERLMRLLARPALRACVWSLRVAPIAGFGLRHSPRLPFVDDHFIILNVARAHERAVFDRVLVNAAHFAVAGGRHAELSAMIEYSVGPDELHRHFVPEASRDWCGRPAPLLPVPFHLCEETGFITCSSAIRPAALSLLARNLAPDDAGAAGLSWVRRGEYWYRRSWVDVRAAARTVRGVLPDFGRHEFKKRYDDK